MEAFTNIQNDNLPEKNSPATAENIVLTQNQQEVFEKFLHFVKDKKQKVFILNGYAGTGKTTLIRFFINELRNADKPFTLMASTGRAAKIATNATGVKASTVHSVIYSFKDFNQDLEEMVKQEEATGVDKTGQLFLQFELVSITDSTEEWFYIVDESSMIPDIKDRTANQALFGSGELLTDLLTFDQNGKFIFVGDECQLPPVGQDISPALSVSYFKQKFKIDAVESILTDIVRQQKDNSIVVASHRIRAMYANPPQVKWAMLPFANHNDIRLHSDLLMMVNRYLHLIGGKDYEKATFIARSNNKCNSANKLIRKSLGMGDLLQVGDLLLVTQNNIISGFMNGDMVIVEQIRQVRYQRAQLTFQLVELRELVSSRRFSQLLIEDILYGTSTNLDQHQQKSLFLDFYKRMRAKGIKQKDKLFKDRLNDDPYLNAIRCVFGYAITCHKAQGGEWSEVFVDIPRNITLNAQPEAYQWIYTAVTRAKEKLHIVRDFFISK